jgi:uncharacterized protein DUF5818
MELDYGRDIQGLYVLARKVLQHLDNFHLEVYMRFLITSFRSWALAAALITMAMPSLGQNASKPGTPDSQQPQPQSQTQTQSTETSASPQSMQTFQGTIGGSEGSFVLKDSTGVTYQLDDQNKAKDFSGQRVKVTGALDAATNTIRVSSIGPAS